MATARRHYFFVADAVGHKPWTDHQFAMFVRLAGHMHERWARDGLTPEQACECHLSTGQLRRITGRGHLDSARKSLVNLSEMLSISLRYEGETVVIQWPKFADFQMLASRSSGSNGRVDGSPGPGPGPLSSSSKKIEDSERPALDPIADEPLTPTELAEGWNEHCAQRFGLPAVTLPLSKARREKARMRCREHPEEQWWGRVFLQVGQSKFLRGVNGSADHANWKATFDFLVANDTNAVKIHEGQYRR